MKKLLASLLVFGVVTSNMVMAVKPAKTTPVVTSEIAKICNNLKAKKADYAALCAKTPAMETEKEQLRMDKIACEKAIINLHAQLRQALVDLDMHINSKAYSFGERNPTEAFIIKYVVPTLVLAATASVVGHYTGNGWTYGVATKASNWWNAEAIKAAADKEAADKAAIEAEGKRLNPGPYPVRTGHGVVDFGKDLIQGASLWIYTPGYKSDWAARNATYQEWQVKHAPKPALVKVGA